ncbi:MAG: hypothetical protein KGM98_14060, partial [Bacteroidota bacterium]|nr:hypothetical protein [Bacteroidota bacterium]
ASAAGLLSAAQWNVVEFHSQNAVGKHYETPDRMVFDLDPGEGVHWPTIIEAAQLMKAFLEELGLVPFAHAGLLQDVYTTGITGSTGAGQALSPTSHFSWRENNIQAYKTLTHQHLSEIDEVLNGFKGNAAAIHFVPWRGDFTRGIFVTSQFKCEKPLSEVYALFESYYQSHPFVRVSRESVFLKQVVNTNNCYIHLEKAGDIIVVHSVIDNLLKGASGQAVQNMNLMFGLEETAGLKLKANYF